MGYETIIPNQARHNRHEDRNQRKAAADVLMELSNSHPRENSPSEVTSVESGVACQTESVTVTSVVCEANVAMVDASSVQNGSAIEYGSRFSPAETTLDSYRCCDS